MAEERVERRLAAILAADVAGYSRLMGVNEEGTLTALKRQQSGVVAQRSRHGYRAQARGPMVRQVKWEEQEKALATVALRVP
jgi:hypothetical protein